MVRVIYRWHVAPNDFDAFRDTWRATTTHIHQSVDGAKGSFLLKSVENDEEVLTVAKWDSLDSWKRFWGEQNPEQMQKMRSMATRISVEAYEEIEDQTV